MSTEIIPTESLKHIRLRLQDCISGMRMIEEVDEPSRAQVLEEVAMLAQTALHEMRDLLNGAKADA